MPKQQKLTRVKSGVYQTADSKYRIIHWDDTAGNRKSWVIADWDGKSWEFMCEVLTLSDARKYLSGEDVFLLS